MNPNILNNKSDQSTNQRIYVLGIDQVHGAGQTDHSRISSFFKGQKNETYAFENEGLRVFYTGLGGQNRALDFYNSGKKLSEVLGKFFKPESTELLAAEALTTDKIESFVLGLIHGAYSIGKKDSTAILNPNFELVLQWLTTNETQQLNKKILAVAQGKFLCMDWLNKGANQKKPEQLVEFLKSMAAENNFEIEIFNREEAAAKGLYAYLAVNQGSLHEAAFTVLKYKHPRAQKTFGLVGKNVVFDTGGISIKPSQNLHYMKSDMGGAAAVYGAFFALTQLKPALNLVAVLPITDNAVDNTAYLPGDVIGSHSGKTIEVIDTDAEGRLTLADGLSYIIKEHGPDFVLDIATLTGSAVRALGYEAAALHSVDQQFADRIRSIGEEIGQRSWQFPLWDEYLENLISDVADLKNFSGQPVADVINSAKFLQQFTHDHPHWAHLDIAGVAFGNNAYSKDKSATGYGVRLITELALSMADE